MLQVAVHHDADVAVRFAQPQNDRTAQSSRVALAMDHAHGQRCV